MVIAQRGMGTGSLGQIYLASGYIYVRIWQERSAGRHLGFFYYKEWKIWGKSVYLACIAKKLKAPFCTYSHQKLYTDAF